MKSKIIKEEKTEEFVPFKLELTVESLNEARILFHVFNNSRLTGIMNDHWYGENSLVILGYEEVKEVSSYNTFSIIKDEITSQGFKV